MLATLLALAALVTIRPALAAEEAEGTFGGDRFLAGDDVALLEQVPGDAFVAGGRSSVGGRVGGDAVVAGGTVEIRGEVLEDIYAAGGDVRVDAVVRGNARIAGGTIAIGRGADIRGNASLAGGNMEVSGRVGGNLQAYGGRVLLDGEVGGDVEVASENIRVGPDARIAGRLGYRGPRPPQVADGAVIAGGIEKRQQAWRGIGPESGAGRVLAGVFRALWFSGVLLLGVVLVALFPRFSREAAAITRTDPFASLGLGIALLVALPILAVMLIITIIGIPLGFALLLGYGLMLMLGYLTAALAVGDLALARAKPSEAGSFGWRLLFLLLALVAMTLLRQVPWIGGLAVAVLFLAGVGAFALRSLRGYQGAAAGT
jgi:hypothetical protein